ncbi:MAG: methyl viologen-reducing hydrogenase [Methanomassiliicoccales archaeon]|nr:MAG: methyl viologen-reducing hydrogenase [Methanomassiliicoccales archaeon]
MARIAEEWFAICGGCEVTILDIGEPLLDLLPQLEFVHMPVLVDHKYYGQTGEKDKLEIPEADIGLISGGVRNEEHKVIAQEMRNKCKTLVALGTCAAFGGIPALGNMYLTDDIYEKIYRQSETTESADTPNQKIPPLTDRVYAVSEVVPVDIVLPGCPTTPELVVEGLTAILEGKPLTLSEKSVCDECPTIREKKAVSTLKRPLESCEFTPGEPLDTVRCLMEQGYLCQGPATRAGCGGAEGTPRCIRAYMPCRGCFGPIREKANPMVDMMGALSSVGLDPKQIPDRPATFNRFAGAQGRLRPLPKR